MDEELPRCIVGKKELSQTEAEELRRERSRGFTRTRVSSLVDGAARWLQRVRGVVCVDHLPDVSQLSALLIAECSCLVPLGSD